MLTTRTICVNGLEPKKSDQLPAPVTFVLGGALIIMIWPTTSDEGVEASEIVVEPRLAPPVMLTVVK
jgi:hypothetical protein